MKGTNSAVSRSSGKRQAPVANERRCRHTLLVNIEYKYKQLGAAKSQVRHPIGMYYVSVCLPVYTWVHTKVPINQPTIPNGHLPVIYPTPSGPRRRAVPCCALLRICTCVISLRRRQVRYGHNNNITSTTHNDNRRLNSRPGRRGRWRGFCSARSQRTPHVPQLPPAYEVDTADLVLVGENKGR